ncbi:hypothetical protein SAY87_031746 [Trapa incisa]|uniref:CRIB domain-containing protein n=2 Tax=Trapa TaxID=22665 RepID=A0AAN7MGS7_TRANT|nr:hypothetical protein SAY87_031746 [Trapa incisa]KAK4797005.1 hypothetical protein SAY86_029331 [Trapa natans]
MSTKVKGILKGLKYISNIFEEGEEQEMVIGLPTDVKHVAHIGMDGPSDAPPTWMNEFKQAQGEGEMHKEDSNSKVSDGDSANKASEGSNSRGAKAANGSQARDLPEVPKPRRHSSSSTGAESPTKAKSEKRRHSRRTSKESTGKDSLEQGRSSSDAECSHESSGKAKSSKPRHSRRSSKGSQGKDFLEPLPSDAESESGLESPRKLPDVPKTRRKKSKDSEGSTRRSKTTAQASKAVEEGGIENRLTAVS